MLLFNRLVFSAGLVCASASAALACAGQSGKVIFSDDFKDDSGGWDVNEHESYIPGGLQITADPDTLNTGSLNTTFNATEGDYCIVIAFPSTPPPADNPDYTSLVILGSDYNNRYTFYVATDGTAWIAVVKNNTAEYPMQQGTKIDSIKTAPGSENILRVVVKDQKLTFYVNGTQIKVLRAQIPATANKFGFFAGSYIKKPSEARVSTVKSFNLTEAQ